MENIEVASLRCARA